MEEPLVSIGIPCYNRPEGLRRTLECITNQSYKNIEIVISDNGSTDPGVQWVGYEFAYRDPRVAYYRQPRDMGGLFNAMFVLKNSHGEYFMWACDDDEWDDAYIKVLMYHMLNDDILLSSSSVILKGPDGDYVTPRETPLSINESRFNAMLFMLLSHHWAYAKGNMIYGIFKRDYLMSGVPIQNECSPEIGSDSLFLIRTLSKGKIHFTPSNLMLKNMNQELNIKLTSRERGYIKVETFPIHILGPIRYVLNKLKLFPNKQHDGIDVYTYKVSEIISKSEFTVAQRIVLRIANQINRIRMMVLY